MAKTDFCFTYYDGDAARDMQHMDRLTRGGYTDFILSQRKFGHLSIDFIRRILGKDFAEIWPQIEIVCRQDEEKKFFIEWLEISIQKASVFSKIQSERKSGKTKQEPNRNQTGTKKNLKGDGDENGDGYEVVEDAGSFGKSENLLNLDLPEIKIGAAVEYLAITKNVKATREMVLILWATFKEKHQEEKYASKSKAYKHFFDSLKFEQINGTHQQFNPGGGKLGTSAARIEAARKF